MTLTDAVGGADFVLIDDVVFETEYLRVPDEDTHADDVVLEAKHGEVEVALIRSDFDGAEHLGDGVYRLANGHRLRFLSTATVH
ncbi:MAG: hypothetical protein HS109_03115 [Burkholderiales bacterium]|nr:hypothetical protein [Burkholderiales bacterium]